MNTNHNHNIEAEEENTTGDKNKFDVLPGRGKGVENHAGNIIYRGLVSASKVILPYMQNNTLLDTYANSLIYLNVFAFEKT
jgi:hypothetical protein